DPSAAEPKTGSATDASRERYIIVGPRSTSFTEGFLPATVSSIRAAFRLLRNPWPRKRGHHAGLGPAGREGGRGAVRRHDHRSGSSSHGSHARAGSGRRPPVQ